VRVRRETQETEETFEVNPTPPMRFQREPQETEETEETEETQEVSDVNSDSRISPVYQVTRGDFKTATGKDYDPRNRVDRQVFFDLVSRGEPTWSATAGPGESPAYGSKEFYTMRRRPTDIPEFGTRGAWYDKEAGQLARTTTAAKQEAYAAAKAAFEKQISGASKEDIEKAFDISRQKSAAVDVREDTRRWSSPTARTGKTYSESVNKKLNKLLNEKINDEESNTESGIPNIRGTVGVGGDQSIFAAGTYPGGIFNKLKGPRTESAQIKHLIQIVSNPENHPPEHVKYADEFLKAMASHLRGRS
jgi:hypothetical protein